MDQLILAVVVSLLPPLVTFLGLVLCISAGFFCHTPSEAKKTAIAGVIVVALGILGLIWPVFVLMYIPVVGVGTLWFACLGVYHAFKPKEKVRVGS